MVVGWWLWAWCRVVVGINEEVDDNKFARWMGEWSMVSPRAFLVVCNICGCNVWLFCNNNDDVVCWGWVVVVVDCCCCCCGCRVEVGW